jgi:2-polyprenyl-3-methyl-5-hydroxy-6-metoxy-1,4-benzoquinol methylase
MFSRRSAERDARRYLEHGLRGTSRELVELAGDVRHASVLDVGGGVGTIGLELLAAGADRATNVDLSSGYEEAAAALAAERGVAERVEHRVGDLVDDRASLAPHDVVVLHRVVCCYPDVDALVGAAAELTERRLLLTYPQERSVLRLGLVAANGFLRLRRCGFRVYHHPVSRIVGAAERHGLRLERRVSHGLVWESAALTR